MIGIFDYTTLFTYIGTLCGMFSVYFAFTNQISISMIWLILAGFFDSLDGTVARSKKNRTEFHQKYGIQLDSLSDVICFGVAPTFLAFQLTFNNIWLKIPCFLYLLTSISRLAWFNVDEEMRRKKEKESRKFYTGLPVTPASIIFPSLYLLFRPLGETLFSYIYIVGLLIVAGLQISKLQIPHLKGKGEAICVLYGLLILILLIIYAM